LIPLRDENPTRTFPIVVVLLIAANVAVFLYEQTLTQVPHLLFQYTYAAIPAVVLGKVQWAQAVPADLLHYAQRGGLAAAPVAPVWLTIFSSMFLHAGLLHLGGNMLYLWIFGNNIEDILGHFRFLVFYLVCGLLAAAAQILLSADSGVPMLGASGAIAGVLGAYYYRFPQARVRTLVIFVVFINVVWLPASLVLLVWFLLQVLHSLSALGAHGSGGVAVFAHLGGFVVGWLLIRFAPGSPRPQPRLSRWE
jgi:membrane associated rhomboid family serine protease